MNATPDPALAVGIDLGGTGTRFVALDRDGGIVGQHVVPTPAGLRAEEALAGLADGIATLAAGAELRSIGIGASGPIDADGVIRNADTLPAFTGFDLIGPLTERFGVPVAIDNDAVTAALGEAVLGAGRPFRSLLMVTLGTGVGVAALVDGAPVRGADGVHAEAGHLSVSGRTAPCYCGRSACWEQVASRSALQRAAGALLADPSDSHRDIALVQQRALAGDAAARAVFDDYGRGIADGLLDLLTVHRSDGVVLGGSAIAYFPVYRGALLGRLQEIETYAPIPPVVVSDLGDLGGALGAAVLGARGVEGGSWMSVGRSA